MDKTVRRGEVWQVQLQELKDTKGHEVAKRRPCLVISVNDFNDVGLEMVVVVPIGTRLPRYVTDVGIGPPEGGLGWEGSIFCDQVRSVSTERLVSRQGTVSDKILEKVMNVITFLLYP